MDFVYYFLGALIFLAAITVFTINIKESIRRKEKISKAQKGEIINFIYMGKIYSGLIIHNLPDYNYMKIRLDGEIEIIHYSQILIP